MKLNELSVSQKIGAGIAGALLIIVVAFGVGAFAASAQTFETFPSQFSIGGVDVSGKNLVAAQTLVQQSAGALEYGVSVGVANYGTYKIPVGKNLIDIDATMAAAKRTAQRGAVTKQLRELFGVGDQINVDFEVTDAAAQAVTNELIADWNVPLQKPTDAKFDIKDGAVTVVPSVVGQTLDLEALSEQFVAALQQNRSVITAEVIEGEPAVTTRVAEQLRPAVAAIAGEITKGRTLKIKDKTYSVTAGDLTTLLQPHMTGGTAKIAIDAGILKSLLGEKLAAFEQQPKNAAFEYQGTLVTKFQAPQTGVVIDWDKLAQDLFASLSTDKNVVTVATKDTEPEITLEKTNNLGIKEIIGIGYSNFAKSPSNRRHNIAVGVNSLKNVLIAPGETFSLMKALGNIDASGGYLQELVIKDNKTIPEYGGGLCQIGTTTFRAAMAAGFSIVMRRNHSYAVPYYFENGLPGTDATIYDPNPDFRFQNDTGHWVMLDPQIKGDDIEFYIWGTSDGRKASRTVPKILSKTPPPPKKIIETTTLAPGVVKCTEKAHTGFSTTFTYTVEYVDGTLKKQDFSSYYKPWGEVCLVGVATSSTIESVSPPILGPLTTDPAGISGN